MYLVPTWPPLLWTHGRGWLEAQHSVGVPHRLHTHTHTHTLGYLYSDTLTPEVGSSSKAFSISSTYADSEDLDEQLSLPHLRYTHLLNTIVTWQQGSDVCVGEGGVCVEGVMCVWVWCVGEYTTLLAYCAWMTHLVHDTWCTPSCLLHKVPWLKTSRIAFLKKLYN